MSFDDARRARMRWMWLRDRLGLELKGIRVEAHVKRPWPAIAVLRDFEARHGGVRYALADGTTVTCSGTATPVTLGDDETLWPVARLDSGDVIYLDEGGAVYTRHDMEGAVERLGDDFDRWLAWAARDAVRSMPAPGPPSGLSATARAALNDCAGDQEVRGGAAAPGELEALLDDLALPSFAAILEAEQRYGGLIARWIRLGPFQMLRDPDFFEWRRARLDRAVGVLAGQMHDGLLYLAADGSVWHRGWPLAPRGGSPRALAASLASWLERCGLVHRICERSAVVLRIAKLSPSHVAARLGAEAVAGGSIWACDDAVVFDGVDPFDGSSDALTVYAARTEVAAVVWREVAERGGLCRLASAPWPSTWAPVLASRFGDALAPSLARMKRLRSPATHRELRSPAEAPRGDKASGRVAPLLPSWPGEVGEVRCRDDGIEQVRAVAGRIVVVQRFADDEERRIAYTALGAEGVERDPRWLGAEASDLDGPTVELVREVERRFAGLRWQRRSSGGVVEGWLGLDAGRRWGHAPVVADGARLLPLGEDGYDELFLSPSGAVLSRRRRAQPSMWHEGHRLREAAESVAALVADRLGISELGRALGEST